MRWPPVGLRASRWALWGQLGVSERRHQGARRLPVALWLALPWQGTEGAHDPSQIMDAHLGHWGSKSTVEP